MSTPTAVQQRALRNESAFATSKSPALAKLEREQRAARREAGRRVLEEAAPTSTSQNREGPIILPPDPPTEASRIPPIAGATPPTSTDEPWGVLQRVDCPL